MEELTNKLISAANQANAEFGLCQCTKLVSVTYNDGKVTCNNCGLIRMPRYCPMGRHSVRFDEIEDELYCANCPASHDVLDRLENGDDDE